MPNLNRFKVRWQQTCEVTGHVKRMSFLHSAVLWASFLFILEQSFIAAADISCNLEFYTQCNGKAEIWCNATSVIEAVRISTNESDVTVVDLNEGQNYSNDPRIWVEIPASAPQGVSKAVIYMSNISFSDTYRYRLYVKVQNGFLGPNYITPTIIGFCAPQIFANEEKQEIVCKVNGNGNGGILEWSDSNQNIWTKSKANWVAVDGIVTLTSIITFDPTSNKDYCCRVTYANQEETAGPVCLSSSRVEPSLSFPSVLLLDQETRLERRRIFLFLPFLVTFILCLIFVFGRRGNLPVRKYRGSPFLLASILQFLNVLFEYF
ncbi:uncharacterized protein [Pleurodeles waltl]|uniref:uncharacterized protein isoform X2 n=2 Tax=Pleurodeles waltl TaxID=8319 RepID=UPI003709B016